LRSLRFSKPPSFPPAFATEAGAVPSTSPLARLPLRSIGTLAGLAVVAATIVYGRHSLIGTPAKLRDLHPLPLTLAGAALLVTLAASAGAWRCALRSAGAELGFREAWGCYGLGSLANAVLPARLGEAVRIGLFAGRLPHADRRWLSGGACLAVAGARAVVYTLTCAGAAAGGLLPVWTLAGPLVAAVALAACLGVARTRARGRTAGLGLAAALSPGAGATLLGWAAVSALTRLAAAVGVLAALDVARPFAAALVGLAALAVGSTVPLAPGGAGVAGVGMALALEQLGVAPSSAVAAAVAFHVLETLASLSFGSTGWVALRATRRPVFPADTPEESPSGLPVLPRQGTAALRTRRRAGARGAARRERDRPGVRAAHVSARTRARRHRPAGDQARLPAPAPEVRPRPHFLTGSNL
jgi:uncharacterized membrane protein YbhN (UPF0104 family)